MITKILGYLLFSHLPAWQRRRQARVAIFVVLITVALAALAGLMMYWINSRR